jgi:hypothetical protein
VACRSGNQGDHSEPIEPEAALQLRQEVVQTTSPHRERLLPAQRLQAHCHALRSTGKKLPRIRLPRRGDRLVDFMSLDPSHVDRVGHGTFHDAVLYRVLRPRSNSRCHDDDPESSHRETQATPRPGCLIDHPASFRVAEVSESLPDPYEPYERNETADHQQSSTDQNHRFTFRFASRFCSGSCSPQ